jgi:hypothetical protein
MLKIYTSAVESAALSQEGTFTTPFATTIDGRTGGSSESRLYVRNDDVLYTYSGIQVTAVDTEGGSVVDGSNGYSWKLSAGDTQPTVDEWSAITAGNTIELGYLGTTAASDTSTYLPFWIQQLIPRNAPVATYTDVDLVIEATGILL